MKSYEYQRALLAMAPEVDANLVVMGMIIQQHIDWTKQTKWFKDYRHQKNWLNKVSEPYGYTGKEMLFSFEELERMGFILVNRGEGGITATLVIPREEWEVA